MHSNFYAQAFGLEIVESELYRWENGLIAHSELLIYGNKIMLVDVDFDNTNFAGFSLAINLTDENELKRAFGALSEGAEILVPLGVTDWSKCYGLLKDKFGITWQFNLD
ncbi:MAG: VOC family protein [Turicibacter sp.]|nr:VOC family protein [Turicibacter sp.]